MKKTTYVALLLLSFQSQAAVSSDAVTATEQQWSSIYYTYPKSKQKEALNVLLNKTHNLANSEPNNPEIKYWEAIILATQAELQDGFNALKSINKSRDLLDEAIHLNPNTANGSAYTTLATLYYMVPKWPIAFGDDEIAENMFHKALKINPNAIDANYFYGDFLLERSNYIEAEKYLQKAISIPSNSHSNLADTKLKEDAATALKNARNRKLNKAKNIFFSLFNSASN